MEHHQPFAICHSLTTVGTSHAIKGEVTFNLIFSCLDL